MSYAKQTGGSNPSSITAAVHRVHQDGRRALGADEEEYAHDSMRQTLSQLATIVAEMPPNGIRRTVPPRDPRLVCRERLAEIGAEIARQFKEPSAALVLQFPEPTVAAAHGTHEAYVQEVHNRDRAQMIGGESIEDSSITMERVLRERAAEALRRQSASVQERIAFAQREKGIEVPAAAVVSAVPTPAPTSVPMKNSASSSISNAFEVAGKVTAVLALAALATVVGAAAAPGVVAATVVAVAAGVLAAAIVVTGIIATALGLDGLMRYHANSKTTASATPFAVVSGGAREGSSASVLNLA